MKIIYQISMVSGSTSTAWIDVTKQQYQDAGLYPEYARRTVIRESDVSEMLETLAALSEYAAKIRNDYDQR